MTSDAGVHSNQNNSTMITTSKSEAGFWLALVLIVIFGVVQTIPYLDINLSRDEAYTANVINLSTADMFEAFRQDTAAPVHYLILKAWVGIFGDSEASLRIPSVGAFGLTIMIVGVIGYRLSRPFMGLIAAMLLATSTAFGLEHAVIARPYSLLSLQVALTGMVYFYLIGLIPVENEARSTRKLWLAVMLVVLNVLALLNQPIYVFFMCAYVLASVFISRRQVILMTVLCAVSVVIYMVIWGPMLQETIKHPALSWMEPPTLTTLANAFSFWGTGKSALMFVVIIGLMLYRPADARKVIFSRIFLVTTAIVIAGMLVPFILTPVKLIFNENRTPFIILPIACLLSGYLLYRLGGALITAGILVIFVSVSGLSSIHAIHRPDPVLDNMRYIINTVTCDDMLILGDQSVLPIEYYFRRYAVPDCIYRRTFPLSTATHPGWIDYPGLLSQPDLLVEEAESLTDSLAVESNKNVWLFIKGHSHRSYPVSVIIKEALDEKLTFVEELDLKGQGFESILIYSTDS